MSVFVESSQRFAGLRTSRSGVSGDGLDDRQVRASGEALQVNASRHAEHAESRRGSDPSGCPQAPR